MGILLVDIHRYPGEIIIVLVKLIIKQIRIIILFYLILPVNKNTI